MELHQEEKLRFVSTLNNILNIDYILHLLQVSYCIVNLLLENFINFLFIYLQSRVSRTITTTLTPSSQNIPITTFSPTGKHKKEISKEKETKDEKPSFPSPIQQSAG